jgi:hypothetical protein
VRWLLFVAGALLLGVAFGLDWVAVLASRESNLWAYMAAYLSSLAYGAAGGACIGFALEGVDSRRPLS